MPSLRSPDAGAISLCEVVPHARERHQVILKQLAGYGGRP
jgi:hypothetical protein